MGEEKYTIRNKKYEFVPPDGGWGYMICVAAIINYLTISMFAGSFGIIYKDFLIEHQIGSTTVALLNGLNIMLCSIAGYMTSPLLKVMSMRMVALIACCFINAGMFATIFANTTSLFFVCQATQCVGMGVIYSISCTVINDYFLKKRLLAISITQTFSAAGAMVAPYLVKTCLDSFGYQGTLVMMSAIYMQSFLAVALMQPVTQHLVRVELDSFDEYKLLVPVTAPTFPEVPVTTPTITLTDSDPPFQAKVIQQDDKGSKNIFKEILDLGMLKKFLLSNASMGPTYCMFAELLFILILPQALYDWHFTKEEVARTISFAAFGDLVTRIIFVFTSKWLTKIGSQEVYLASVFLAFVSRILMLWTENTTAIMVFITITGIARCSITVMPPLILAESFSSDDFTKVLGIFMMMLGFMTLVLGPAIGAIRDLTNSYSTAFYVITSCYAVVVLLWSIELLYKRSKGKRQAQADAADILKQNVTNKVK